MKRTTEIKNAAARVEATRGKRAAALTNLDDAEARYAVDASEANWDGVQAASQRVQRAEVLHLQAQERAIEVITRVAQKEHAEIKRRLTAIKRVVVGAGVH